MSLFSIFKSGIFKTKSSDDSKPVSPVKEAKSTPVIDDQPTKSVAPTPTVDTAAIIAQATATAQIQAREIIISAKDEAFKLKDQAIKDARIQLEDIELKSKSLSQKQQILVQEESNLKKQKQENENIQKQLECHSVWYKVL